MSDLTPERFEELLASYGGDSRRWPAAEQHNAVHYLRGNPEAQRQLLCWQILDTQLDSFAVPVSSGLESRLLRHPLPLQQQGPLELVATWLLPDPRRVVNTLWRPAVLACVPLLLGLFIGGTLDLTVESYALSPFEEELYFLSLSDYAESL